MTVDITTLIGAEIRKMWNQFKRTITTPSMLMFYTIVIAGSLFISYVATLILNVPGFTEDMISAIDETLDVGMLFKGMSLLTVAAVFGGYFGIGPAAVMTTHDEYILMPSPVKPHQLFVARYLRRLVRKFAYFGILLIIVLPMLSTMSEFSVAILAVGMAVIVFLEINYFIGGVVWYLRIHIAKRFSTHLRHLFILPLLIIPYILSLDIVAFSSFGFLVPSNALVILLAGMVGLAGITISPFFGYYGLLLLFITFLAVLAGLCNYDYYEAFTTTHDSDESENKYNNLIRGEIDFSQSRFKDPMMWLILKDFWSRMRSPLQFWKYLYIVIGIIFAFWLNFFSPSELMAVTLPPEVAYTAEPAFILILVMMLQMTSISGLMTFVDERDNIYLLKVTPFRGRDIIISKYILSLIEVTLASIPILGLLAYVFRTPSSAVILSFAAPLIMIFTATGVMVGAYVPVFTNTPESPPVPLAFSFPAINLALGIVFVSFVSYAINIESFIPLVPLFVTGTVTLFLLLAIRALNMYR